jgi:general secretion pathway protein C
MDWKHYKALGAEALIMGRSASWATALCVVLLAYSAARLTWMLVPIPLGATVPPPSMVAPTMGSPANDALSLSREIVAKHLFGQAQTATATSELASIPETQLKLELRGVMASQDPHTATAIVADPSGNEDFYTVGEELPGGATLKEVHAQYIVLSRNGRFETLRLPADALNISNGVLARPDTTTATTGVSPDAGALLQQYRDQFIRDPQSLANLLQGEPYWQNGRMIGYRLRPGRDPGVLEKLGIHSGDVVTAVNGVSLTDPGGRMELLRNMNNATQFNVELLRGGRPITISIPVGQRG